jgi:mRNA interferase MazF
MVKPVAGEIVVIPFPRTDSGKRRPAFVIADLPGADLILCQITSRAHSDGFAVALDYAIVNAANSISRATFARNAFSASNTTSFFTHSGRSLKRNSKRS